MIGPDFLCIGAIKGGTTWLYDQLRLHPDCWMPPIKEIHYFNRARKMDFPSRMFARMALRARYQCDDPRDRAFFAALESCAGHRVQADLYAQMFAPKGALISGDVSPGYACLPGNVIAQIANDLPATKIIFMARDPVDRAWSHISMRWRQGGFNARLLWSEALLRSYLDDTDMQQASFPSRTMPLWAKHFGPERFQIFEYEDTVRDSEFQRAQIFSFIGLDPAKQSGTLSPDFNVKHGREKLDLTPEARGWLQSYYADECAAWSAMRNDTLRPWVAPWSAETRAI